MTKKQLLLLEQVAHGVKHYVDEESCRAKNKKEWSAALSRLLKDVLDEQKAAEEAAPRAIRLRES